MNEIKQEAIKFTLLELVALMAKERGLKQGIWGLSVQFGIAAMNTGPNENEIFPAAIVPIGAIGLQPFPKESNIAMDVSKLWPAETHK